MQTVTLIGAGISGLGDQVGVDQISSVLVGVALIFIISMAHILYGSKYWSEKVSSTLNSALLSLLLILSAIVLLKITLQH